MLQNRFLIKLEVQNYEDVPEQVSIEIQGPIKFKVHRKQSWIKLEVLEQVLMKPEGIQIWYFEIGMTQETGSTNNTIRVIQDN